MSGDNERGIVPLLNPSHSPVKIDSLCIKLGIMKGKDDALKCRHFSIRGFVAGMREKGRCNLLPFAEELPPMQIPDFKYWLCQKCLQYDQTVNASNETTLISACDQRVFPFGEGTSGLKPVEETVLHALRSDRSQTCQEIPAKVKVFQQTVDTIAGTKENSELKDHENSQERGIVNHTISQTIESGQQNDNCQNGLPRRKARKVRLLKELLCGAGNTEIQQHKKENSSPLIAPSVEIKRKMLHDHDHDDDDDDDDVDVDVDDDDDEDENDDDYQHDDKKTKAFKESVILKASRVEPEHSRNPGAREFGENINKYEWNKHGTQRSSILGRVNSDAVTAWRTIFSDIGRPDNRVPPAYSAAKSRGPEPYGPYSNIMNPPKSDKKVNSSKKITINPIERNFSVKDSNRSHAELGLNLSLNYDAQSHIRSQPSILSQPPSQDYYRNSGFFMGESSNFPNRIIPSDLKSKERSVHEKRLYTQLPYGSYSGHQKLDFSDPYKRNIGVNGYSEFTRPNNHQRQEKMLSVGRSDEREIIELLAKNQYERNLSEANNNRIMTGFHKLNMYEGTRPWQHEYFTMGETPGPMRNHPAGSFFHEDQVSSFTTNPKKPLHGVWISDPKSQRHYDSQYPYASYASYASNGSNKRPQTHLYKPSNIPVLDGFNKYNNGGNQNTDKGKNMMDLDLNLAVEEHNSFEPLDLNPKRMRSFDSSYSNETIPAMQLLSLMDAGKSSQPFSLTGQPLTTKPKSKPVSICYSHCSSTNEKTNPLVNPIGASSFSVFQTSQNTKLTYSHGQQDKSTVASIDPYASPLPRHGTESQNKPVNSSFATRFDTRTEICTINRNPADFSTPGPENVYMITIEDLVFNQGCSYREAIHQRMLLDQKLKKR